MMAPNKGLLCFGPTFADPEDSYIDKEDEIAVMKDTDMNMDKKLVDANEKPESNITEDCVDEDESDHIEILEMRKCLVHNDGISRREDDGRSKTERDGVAMRRMCSRLDGKYWTDVSCSNERMSPRVKSPTRKSETVEKETGQQVRSASVTKLNLTM